MTYDCYCYVNRSYLLISVSCDGECDIKVAIVVGELRLCKTHFGPSVFVTVFNDVCSGC